MCLDLVYFAESQQGKDSDTKTKTKNDRDYFRMIKYFQLIKWNFKYQLADGPNQKKKKKITNNKLSGLLFQFFAVVNFF